MSRRGKGKRIKREAVPEMGHDGKGGVWWEGGLGRGGLAEPIILKGIKSSDLLLS